MKKLSIIGVLLLTLSLFLGSCSEDKDTGQVSDEWIAYQKQWVSDVIVSKDADNVKYYVALPSDLGEGRFVYHRPSEFIANNIKGAFDYSEPNAFPKDKKAQVAVPNPDGQKLKYETDVALVRYHGWYYNLEGKRVLFDSTEDVNGVGKAIKLTPGGVVEGFRAALYDMTVGEERIVCMPHNLAYGTRGTGSIPGYTTLFFDIKLMEIQK